MTTDERYNGWTNYETWCVNLWLSNDEPLYRDVCQIAADYFDELDDEDKASDDPPLYDLGVSIREYVEELEPAASVLSGASFVSDLLSAALGEVDWQEIAGHWISDAREQSDYESAKHEPSTY